MTKPSPAPRRGKMRPPAPNLTLFPAGPTRPLPPAPLLPRLHPSMTSARPDNTPASTNGASRRNPAMHTLSPDPIQKRNLAWQNHPLIPAWVDLDKVGLDEFYTRPEVAQTCHASLLQAMTEDYADTGFYKFVDPSAGTGAFYDLLPQDRRTGIEITATRPEFEPVDFLSWTPKPNGRRYAVIGNPPFGYRAWLALAFVNHAASFADYIGMILPMAFQSDGKGSPKHRVVGAELIRQEPLARHAFLYPNGQPAAVNALWQVWRRGVNNRRPAKTCDSWVELFTVDMRKTRLCGQERMKQADYFLQRTFYRHAPRLVRDFAEVRYVCGYGIVIRKQKKEVARYLNSVNWEHYSNLAAHNCRHISMYHIRRALTDGGFHDL